MLARARRLRAAAPAARRRRRPASCRAVSLIVAAYDEEEVIAAKVANALALDYPRERLELIVASDGSTDAHRRARPRGRRRPRARAAARRQGRGPERRRRAGRRRDRSPSRRQRELGARRAAPRWSRAFADPEVGYVCGQVRFIDAERRQPGGRLLALRDGGARARVGPRRGHRRQRRRSTPCARAPTCPLAPVAQPRPLVPVRARQARAGAPSTSPAARAEEKMVPTIEGEFARKRRMMVGLWDIVVGDRMMRPARLPARSTPSRSSPTGCSATRRPLLHLVAARRQPRCCSAQGRVYVAHARRSRLPPLLGDAAAGGRSRWPAPDRPLLRAGHRLDRAGLWDRLRHGPPAAWEKAEGTR